ncbi:Holliday junction resolvase [Klebsormidium nitens]|uniref:Holliday junction resolvase n=1 Tax=Klebsormidium nitens TaxID=105231 RepID=A0A1Y1I3V8_KLENI|nr:Holliday junction resolvase [Klebsormidium nitens]|eukprot:GAQ83416.1 Holliday junction resolvase [Klebsormidium nitens]
MNLVSLRELAQLVQANKGGRLLGLDVGTSSVGVAISDTVCRIAHVHSAIYEKLDSPTMVKSAAVIENAVSNEGVIGLVVGSPLDKSGREPQKDVLLHRLYLQRVHEASRTLAGLPTLFFDESNTTQIVNSSLRHMAPQPYAVMKPLKDKLSAVYILQGCLDELARMREEAGGHREE